MASCMESISIALLISIMSLFACLNASAAALLSLVSLSWRIAELIVFPQFITLSSYLEYSYFRSIANFALVLFPDRICFFASASASLIPFSIYQRRLLRSSRTRFNDAMVLSSSDIYAPDLDLYYAVEMTFYPL